jgi:hypothetical protein
MAGVLCLLILGGYAVAGFWPFRRPVNDITWLPGGKGVRFGAHGTLLATGPLDSPAGAACSIELWVRPDRVDVFATLLSFYGPDGSPGFAIRQSLADLRLDGNAGRRPPGWVYVPDFFVPHRLVLITVVTGPGGSEVYVDGSLIRRLVGAAPPPAACSGNFVVGDGPGAHSSWRGEFRGLAVYQTWLPAEQVKKNAAAWKSRRGMVGPDGGPPDLLYTFGPAGGRVVRGLGRAAIDLQIPETYTVIHQTLLESPRSAFTADGWQGYLWDLFVNVVGFIPFGIAMGAFLHHRGAAHAWAMTVVAGLLVSLSIESLQSILPTRNSDLTDVITNTLGTWTGAWIYLRWGRRFF